MPKVTFNAISRKLPGGLAVENTVRDFKFIMDEPPSLGGADTGMNPVEAVLCALGSCQMIVAAAFAKAQGIDLQDVWMELEGDLDTDGFLMGKPGVRNGFDEIRYTMHIKSSSPKDKIKEFAEFVESRCPVSDNLHNGAHMVRSAVVIEK